MRHILGILLLLFAAGIIVGLVVADVGWLKAGMIFGFALMLTAIVVAGVFLTSR